MYIHENYIGNLTDSYFRWITECSNPELLDNETLLSFEIAEYIAPPPPEPVVYIPQQVTMRQARLILLQYNLLDSIDAQVQTFPRSAQIEWEYAAIVDRSNPLLAMIGLTAEELDQMFIEASLL